LRTTVTRLRPRGADYETARRAFLAGDYLCCVESLNVNVSIAAVALRARSYVRMNRFSEAIDALSSVVLEDTPH
jgi:hypothetical protein